MREKLVNHELFAKISSPIFTDTLKMYMAYALTVAYLPIFSFSHVQYNIRLLTFENIKFEELTIFLQRGSNNICPLSYCLATYSSFKVYSQSVLFKVNC